MQFARAARPGGNPGAPAAVLAAAGGSRRMSRVRGARVSCRPCSCGRQPGCAEAFLSASFVFPSLLSRFRRGSGRPSKGRVWAGLRVRENPRFLASNPRSGTERAHPGALRSAFIANRIRRPGLFPGAGTLLRRERAGCVPERGFVAKNDRFRRTNSEPPQSTQPNRHPEARLRTRPPSSPRPSGKQTRTERVAQAQRPRTNKPKKQSDDITCGKARLGRSSERGTTARAKRRGRDYAAA